MATPNYFVVKNGLAVGNTTFTRDVINNSGQFIGDWTGVIQDSYDQANIALSLAQSSYNQANSASSNTIYLQSVNDYQNTHISNVEGYSQSAYAESNTNAGAISIIQGVDLYQNTYIGNVESYAQSGYAQANSATTLAQDAYNYANTIAISGGSAIINDDNSTNNVFYITFANTTSGVLTNIDTSSANLTFNPSTGTLGSSSFEINQLANLSAANTVAQSLGTLVIDSFDITKYRSAFYQVQLEASDKFQSLSLNVLHNGSSAFISTYNYVTTAGTIGTFSADVVSGVLQLIYTPSQSPTAITFVRTIFAKTGPNVPIGDLGYTSDPVTIYFDAGFDADPVATTFDYGTFS